jgi:hypothetical protein
MATITFKATEAEAAAIRTAARKNHVSVSAYIRKATAPAMPAAGKFKKFALHPISGLPYDPTPGPLITREQVAAAMEDFP